VRRDDWTLGHEFQPKELRVGNLATKTEHASKNPVKRIGNLATEDHGLKKSNSVLQPAALFPLLTLMCCSTAVGLHRSAHRSQRQNQIEGLNVRRSKTAT
jgi:hypothetical protein